MKYLYFHKNSISESFLYDYDKTGYKEFLDEVLEYFEKNKLRLCLKTGTTYLNKEWIEKYSNINDYQKPQHIIEAYNSYFKRNVIAECGRKYREKYE